MAHLDLDEAARRLTLDGLSSLRGPEIPQESPQRIDVDLGAVTIPLLVVRRPGAKRLVVLHNGAVDLERSSGAPVFQRSSWWQEIDSHQIFVCDPGTVGANALPLNWFQAAPPQFPLGLLAKAIKELSRSLGVASASERLYFGSSAGGFAALQLLAYAPRARAVVNNAQFDWTRWYAPAVKSVLEVHFPNMDAATVRRRWPRRANALQALTRRSAALRVDYWCNVASQYDRTVQLPILEKFIRQHPGIASGMEIHQYEDPRAGHNPLSAQRTIDLLNNPDGISDPNIPKGAVVNSQPPETQPARRPFADEGEHPIYKVPVRIHAEVSDAFTTSEPQIVAAPIPDGPHLQAYGRVQPSRVLRVVFHGAVRAETDRYPRFDRISTMMRTQDSFVSIADPTLAENPDLTLAWYAGTSRWDPTPLIDELIQRAMKQSGAEEVWFIGGSGGGLAAMRHARLVDGALVFAFSPQTDASEYRGRSFPLLLETCFDGLDVETAKAEYPGRFEVVSSYSQGTSAWIYYLQNLTDPGHITDHYLPFLHALGITEACGDSADGRVRAALIAQKREGHGPPLPEEFEDHLARAVDFLHARLGRPAPIKEPQSDCLESAITRSLEELSEQVNTAIETTNRTYRALNRQLGILPWNVEAYHRLAGQLVPTDKPLPPAGSFALRTPGIEELTRLIHDYRPEVVVECGSGSSTVWMASQFERLGFDGHIYSLEHDPHYAHQTRLLLEHSGLSERATVLEAPLEDTADSSGRIRPWYSQTALDELPPRCDLLFVDGPPSSKGKGIRARALEAFESRLGVGGLIVVDDVQRADEAAMVRSWSQRADLAIVPGFVELAVLNRIDTRDRNENDDD